MESLLFKIPKLPLKLLLKFLLKLRSVDHQCTDECGLFFDRKGSCIFSLSLASSEIKTQYFMKGGCRISCNNEGEGHPVLSCHN